MNNLRKIETLYKKCPYCKNKLIFDTIYNNHPLMRYYCKQSDHSFETVHRLTRGYGSFVWSINITIEDSKIYYGLNDSYGVYLNDEYCPIDGLYDQYGGKIKHCDMEGWKIISFKSLKLAKKQIEKLEKMTILL